MEGQKILVLYHDDADGFGAAYALWHYYTKERGLPVEFIPVQYKQPIPKEAVNEYHDIVYIVDFCYEGSVIDTIPSRRVVVIDHHKSSTGVVLARPGCVHDVNHSGCVLTWTYLYPNQEEPVPELLSYIEDRDLWKWELPWSREVNLFLSTVPKEFSEWDKFNVVSAAKSGMPMIEYKTHLVERNTETVGCVCLGAFHVPCVNATVNVNEVAEKLLEKYPQAPFVAVYSDEGNGLRAFALRSRGQVDVSLVAEQFGGGGHAKAAGFRLSAPPILYIP